MLLRALKDLPTSVNAIVKGEVFNEPSDLQAKEWIATGYAEAFDQKKIRPAIPELPAKLVWTGATVVVVASGPSLTAGQCEDVQLWQMTPAPEPRRVIAINTSFRMAPFADILYACDGTWWKMHYEEAARSFKTDRMWTQDEGAAKTFNIQLIKSASGKGLSRRPDLIHQGMNSTYQAINLAFLAGARRFILLGVDCHGGHWHGDHPKPLSNSLPHRQWKEKFTGLAADLTAEGVVTVNCSPGTALRAFPTAELEEELSK